MASHKQVHSPALQHAFDTLIGDDPKRRASFEQETLNIEFAQMLYDLRTKAGLSQRELAQKVGTRASVICRLEDADYRGDSVTMLRRIASALRA